MCSIRSFINIVKSFLNVRRKPRETVGNARGDFSVSIQNAGRVSTVNELSLDCVHYSGSASLNRHYVLIEFSALLPCSGEYDRCPEIAGIPNETTGISNSAGRIRKHL